MTGKDELDADTIHQAIWGEAPGSGRAFARLYAHYEKPVRYGVARAAHRRGYTHQVDEIRQEVWVRLLDRDRKMLRYYDPERGPLGPFLARMAYQQALQIIDPRSRRDDITTPLRYEAIDRGDSRLVAEIVQSDLYRRLLVRAQAELEELDLLIVREVHLGQRRFRDVALEHGVRPERLYKRNERLLKRLARWGEELLADPRQPPVPPGVVLLLLVAGLAGLAAAPQALHPPPSVEV